MNEGKNTALVLSGGGAKGAFQVGALKVLKERGYTFDAVSGVSVGALNGSMLVTDQFEALLKIWNKLTPDMVVRKNSFFKIGSQYLLFKAGVSKPPMARFDNGPLRNLVKDYLIGEKAQKPFHFGYVKLDTGRYVNAIIQWDGDHSINEGDINRVMASTAIPAFFTPSRIGDTLGVDGGIRNISPIADILPYNPDRLILIPTEPVGEDKERDDSRDIIQIALRAIDIMLDEIFNEDIGRFFTINRLVRQAEEQGAVLRKNNGSAYKYIDPILIAPKESLGSPINFENDNIIDMMKKGEERAREVLDGMSG